MGRKATPTKEKKAKPAAKTGKGALKPRAQAAPKRPDKAKPVDKVAKDRAEQPSTTKSVVASAKPGKPDRKAKGESPGKTVKLDKSAKIETKAGALASKAEPKNNSAAGKNSAKMATAHGKLIVRPTERSREPREIGGLPKVPAFRGPFDRPQRIEDRGGHDSESRGGNGDSHDETDSTGTASTYLTDAELEEFRELLTAKRQEIVRDVTNLEDEAIRQASSGGATSSMPIHMADLGTDTWEQELTLGLIENERNLLREIDEALERVNNKTYGMCLATNKRISKTRLQAKPWAKYCIEYARKRELGLA